MGSLRINNLIPAGRPKPPDGVSQLGRDSRGAAEHENRILVSIIRFVGWVEGFSFFSHDHQSFFAGPIGRRAKQLYYRNKALGTLAVAPMIFCEAFLPQARKLFGRPLRFPIADAHYAMGFAFLFEETGERKHREKAVEFLEYLIQTRCPGYEHHCWGYPFDWVTRNGTIPRNTPLITTTPYVYEAFLQVYQLDGDERWRAVLKSITQHTLRDIRDFNTSETASSCSYTPFDQGGVINAAAYRAFLLTSAAAVFSESECDRVAERNLNFVLENQNEDGSWYYAVDGARDFVDHFHTCFVMKALAKIERLTGHEGCRRALAKGVQYYRTHLFDKDGLPKPFSRAPRMTVYKRELYDYAECVNLCLLLKDRFPDLEKTLEKVLQDLLSRWIKPDGSFRSRELHFGWDNVPMHRWAQSQMFRSLSLLVRGA